MSQLHFLENGSLSDCFRLEVVCSTGKFSSLLLHRLVSFFFLSQTQSIITSRLDATRNICYRVPMEAFMELFLS